MTFSNGPELAALCGKSRTRLRVRDRTARADRDGPEVAWARRVLRNGESGEVNPYLRAVAPSFKRPREHPEANSTDKSAKMISVSHMPLDSSKEGGNRSPYLTHRL